MLAFWFLGLLAFHAASVNAEGCTQTCLDTASCVDGECVCDSGDEFGDPTLACYRSNEFGSQVINDPSLMTFNKNFVSLPVPCRYLYTHMETELKNRSGSVVGSCLIKMHVHHSKAKGKIHVGGYSLAISAIYDNGTTVSASFIVDARTENGVHNYDVSATWGMYVPDGPWWNDDINFDDKQNSGLQMILEEDTVNDRLAFEVKKCGWRSYIRPYDRVLRLNQPRTPGVSVAVNCANHPEFLSPNKTMALPPTEHHGFDINTIRLPGLTNSQTMINRALTTDIPQNQDNSTVECSNAKAILEQCDDTTRPIAFNACDWILNSPRYIRCLNPGPTCAELMATFNGCVDVFCGGADCSTFQAYDLPGNNNCNTVTGYDKLDLWNSGSFCMMNS